MKRITINMINEEYIITCDSVKIASVDKTNLILNGKDLYDNLFVGLDLNCFVEFDIEIGKEIIDSNDKRLANDLKTIFEKIINNINTDFNLKKEDVNAPNELIYQI